MPQLRYERIMLVRCLRYRMGDGNATYPVVVMVGQVQLAKVDGAKRIGVANKVALPVVVEVVP